MPEGTPPEARPIGYWVKLLDRLIDRSFDETLGGEGLTRRHWQVLNVMRAAPTDQDGIDAAVAPFLDGPEASTGHVVAELVGRDWVSRTGEVLSLTDTGRLALADLHETVSANRARIAEGLSEDEYVTTVRTLARMCHNLGHADA